MASERQTPGSRPKAPGPEPDEAALTPPALPLREPGDGIPDVTSQPESLAVAARRLTQASGPIAVDAERASGHRYGQRAFLIQLRREGAGTWLIDPVALPDLASLCVAVSGPEWVLHSATQDLPCLAELGLRPKALFDTELAGRLLGLARVGLAGLTEDLLGIHLAKGHGAADWSKRPLPAEWLAYAALDVELLLPLREVLSERLTAAGRAGWAAEEFAALVDFSPRVRAEPWRRTAGIHRVKDRRALAVVRELWRERDDLARAVDRPPGRVLPDAAIIAASQARPSSRTSLAELPEFARQRRALPRWWRAIQTAMATPADQLPDGAHADGPPPPRTWERRNPAAAARLAAVRGAITARAEDFGISAEILVAPDAVRALVWECSDLPTAEQVEARLAGAGVRPWQREIVVPLIAEALAAA